MFKAHNDWLQRISAQLAVESIDYANLDKLLAQYESAIVSHVKHFAVIEGETRAQRRAVERNA